MKKLDVYRKILSDLVERNAPLDDVLWLAWVLHTHRIQVAREIVVEDVRGEGDTPTVLHPLTRAHLAEMLSSLWSNGTERGQPGFWASEYARAVAYEVPEDVPPTLRDRAQAALASVESHAIVSALAEDV